MPTTGFPPELEQAVLRAFEKYVNKSAFGLDSTLRHAAQFAQVEDGSSKVILDRRDFLLGLLSYGLEPSEDQSSENTAHWVAEWSAERLGEKLRSNVSKSTTGLEELRSNVLKGRTDPEALAHLQNSAIGVAPSTSMTNAAMTAVSYAQRTVGRNQADLRHFFAAFIADTADTIDQLSQLDLSLSDGEMATLRQVLFQRIGANPEAEERMDQWRAILRIPSQVPGFTSDHVDTLTFGGDPLEVLPDVEAFARLICLEEAEPPLSIGLFGSWGSGKTTFMQLLEREIDELTQRTRESRQADSTPPGDREASNRSTFVHNVVQIRFNAWHFADANIWASLTAEFFDQLRAGGYARSGPAVHTRLVERVNAHVHALTSKAATAQKALLESETDLCEAQKKRDQAVEAAKAGGDEPPRQTIIDAVTRSFEAYKGDLGDLLRYADLKDTGDGAPTQRGDPVKDIQGFLNLAKELQKVRGQLKALWRFVRRNWWRSGLTVVGLIASIAGLVWIIKTNAGNAWSVVPILGGAGAFARAVIPGVKIISGLIESTSSFAPDLDDGLQERIMKVAPAEEALRRAAEEADARREAAQRADKALARYVDADSAVATPTRLLRYLLEDDPDTHALENEIGLISRVRRLFQAVDEIVQAQKNENREATDSGREPDSEVPDRIVIYIDDLDRCTPAQVYAVLQAIHLLLAFKLFVVVVGVDVAWVEEALVHELRPNLNDTPPSNNQRKSEIDERTLAVRYLEKIFQLPFWLLPLSAEGDSGGSYGRFVRALLSPGDEPETPESQSTGENTSAGNGRTDAAISSGAKRDPQAGPTGDAARPVKRSTEQENETALAEAIETVRLTDAEIDFLASAEIGGLSRREPRTVKRFINTYRIVRAGLGDADRARFLGENGVPPEYGVAAVMIAVETGQPLDVAESVFHRMKEADGDTPVGENLPPQVGAALKAAQRTRNGAEITHASCLHWAKAARRYSFNRYN